MLEDLKPENVFYYFGVDLNWCGINNTLIQRLIVAGIIFLSVALIILALIKGEGTVGNKIILTVMTLALPVAVNSIYLMSSSENYSPHILMRYSLVFVFIIPIILLEHTKRPISEISTYLGFQTQSNFGAIFKKWQNMTPTEYRNKNYREVY